MLLIAEKYLPRLPSPLVAMVVAGVAVKLMGLDGFGVKRGPATAANLDFSAWRKTGALRCLVSRSPGPEATLANG